MGIPVYDWYGACILSSPTNGYRPFRVSLGGNGPSEGLPLRGRNRGGERMAINVPKESGSLGVAVLSVGIVLASVAGCATSGAVVVEDEGTRVEVVFSDRDRTLIHDYYRRRGLPPGLAKRSSLPPGLQKQVQRRGQLPPGLQRERLPNDLEIRLSPLPEGYVRVRVGADVVLMNMRTRVIVDVIKDIGG